MGSVWEGLGEVLGGICRLLGPLGSSLELFFSCLYLQWSSKVVLEASGLDFGSIVEGLGRILGRFGEVLGGILTHFREFWLFLGSSMVWGHFWAILGRFGLLLQRAARDLLGKAFQMH